MEKDAKLEDVRDYIRRKGHGDRELCLILEQFWPGSDENDKENMSAMDCLVVVFRHIYSHVVPRGVMDTFVAPNELLTFALSNFGAEMPEKPIMERKARERMYGAIVRDCKLREKPNFANLFESEVMLKSIWAHESFRLCYPIIHRRLDSGASDWSVLPDDQQAILEARQSLVVWDTSQHEKLEDALKDKFGLFEGWLKELGRDKVRFTMFNKSPVVIRVKMLPKKKLGNFDIKTIKEIKVPVYLPRVTSKTGSVPANRIVSFRRGGLEHYRLTATVKLRASESERDRVRLYDMEGRDIVPITPKAEVEGFVEDSWLVEHQDSSYMLYYLRGNDQKDLQDEVEEAVDGAHQLIPVPSTEEAPGGQGVTKDTSSVEGLVSVKSKDATRPKTSTKKIYRVGHTDSDTS